MMKDLEHIKVDQSKLRMVVETITPEKAQARLERMTFNRPTSWNTVARYAKAMAENRWILNGEALQLDHNGVPINGAHRYRACIEADTPFTSLVVHGLPPEVMLTIDTGKTRSAGDVLHMHDVKYYHTVASAVRWHAIIPQHGGPLSSSADLDNAQVLEFVRDNPGIVHSASIADKTKLISPAGLTTALHFIWASIDSVAADKFLEDLREGSSLSSGDPILVLRNRLIKDRGLKRKITREDRVTLFIRAWNQRRAREFGKVLQSARIGADNKLIIPAINR